MCSKQSRGTDSFRNYLFVLNNLAGDATLLSLHKSMGCSHDLVVEVKLARNEQLDLKT